MNTLLAILKVTHARRDVILAGRLYNRFPWRHLPLPPPAFAVTFSQAPHKILLTGYLGSSTFAYYYYNKIIMVKNMPKKGKN